MKGDAYFIETVFNPWQVAVNLSSREEVFRMQKENPRRLLDALDVLTESSIHHAKRAFATGAAGILFAIANPKRSDLSPEEYARFSAPFDKRIVDATAGARLNFLHLHCRERVRGPVCGLECGGGELVDAGERGAGEYGAGEVQADAGDGDR